MDLARQATIPRPHITSPNDVPTPATFTPLPDDIFLPFIDRPTEVATLISSPPDVKLFTLLAQIFAKPQSSPVDRASKAEKQAPVDLPRDPVQWTYPQLVHHLTKIDRDIAPDFIWTIAARKCIFSHSELIWERIKGALGVPPELDVDYDFLDDDQDSPDTSDISDDEGRAAKGHWSDWDEVLDSPQYGRNPKRLSDSPVASMYLGAKREEEAHFRAQMDDRLQGLQDTSYDVSPRAEPDTLATESAGEATIVPTPHVRSPPDQEQNGIVFGMFSPPLITHREPTLEKSPEYISIEPLLASAPSPSNFSGSGTNPSDGLGDIAEGAEEEEDITAASAESTTGTSSSPHDYLSAGSNVASPGGDGMISPSQIQGLRISTSPLPPSGASTSSLPLGASTSFGTPPVLSPISPLPPYPSQPVQSSSSASSINNGSTGASSQPQAIPASGSHGSRPHSRASSFSSVGPFQRSESTGNLAASWTMMAASAAVAGGSQYAGSVFGSEAGDSSGYMSDGDRGPGQPLFPSNFARLAGGPTMKAK